MLEQIHRRFPWAWIPWKNCKGISREISKWIVGRISKGVRGRFCKRILEEIFGGSFDLIKESIEVFEKKKRRWFRKRILVRIHEKNLRSIFQVTHKSSSRRFFWEISGDPLTKILKWFLDQFLKQSLQDVQEIIQKISRQDFP